MSSYSSGEGELAVTLKGVKLLQTSEEAWQVQLDGFQFCIPKSICMVTATQECFILTLPLWLANRLNNRYVLFKAKDTQTPFTVAMAKAAAGVGNIPDMQESYGIDTAQPLNE